jgi:hypothetical protein
MDQPGDEEQWRMVILPIASADRFFQPFSGDAFAGDYSTGRTLVGLIGDGATNRRSPGDLFGRSRLGRNRRAAKLRRNSPCPFQKGYFVKNQPVQVAMSNAR